MMIFRSGMSDSLWTPQRVINIKNYSLSYFNDLYRPDSTLQTLQSIIATTLDLWSTWFVILRWFPINNTSFDSSVRVSFVHTSPKQTLTRGRVSVRRTTERVWSSWRSRFGIHGSQGFLICSDISQLIRSFRCLDARVSDLISSLDNIFDKD